jgi:hypothetical protein
VLVLAEVKELNEGKFPNDQPSVRIKIGFCEKLLENGYDLSRDG